MAFTLSAKACLFDMLQKWMDHARMETTFIYINAVGEEQGNITA
ncbi:MAG: hypothetical protein R3B44_05930 [Candidatus Brocadiaceae bacterium]